MPSTLGHSQHHARREEYAPDARLKEYMYP